MELKRVVVTGLGAVTPLGNTPEETWESLLAGKSGAAPITHFDASLFKTQFACEVKNLNINDYIDRKEARKLDRYTQLAMISAMQGVKDSGLDLEKEDLNRIGVIYGVGIGGIKTFEDEVSYYGAHPENGPKFNPFFIPKMIADIASGQISIHFGFHGPNYTTTSACASSSNALADAFNLIRLGKANIIVSGGAEAAICACGVGGFNAMHALSTRNDDPEHASRPFSASRDGFIMGEGAGCLILEELEHAKARGAKIYAEMVGEGESADAYHITASHPEGLGAKLVMERALADANLKPEDIDYINEKGLNVIRQHAQDFIAKREAPAFIPNDGKQTPTKGHPVFIAQHATATCCRECIRKWHKMQPGRELSQVQQDYLVDVIMTWIEKELARAKEN